jgi:hypothetical protein
MNATMKKYAKGVVAVATFVALVAGQVASGHLDANTVYVAGVALLGALGVITVPNKPSGE